LKEKRKKKEEKENNTLWTNGRLKTHLNYKVSSKQLQDNFQKYLD